MAGPWEKYQKQEAQAGPWTAYAPAQMPAVPQMPYEQQIVGGVAIPPPLELQTAGAPAQWGAQDYLRHGSDLAGDVAGAGLAGVGRGVIGMAGLPGTLNDLAQSGITAGLEFAGLEDQQTPRSALSTHNISQVASALTDGASDFRGDTMAGKVAGTVGEFLPGAALFGGTSPGNLIRYGAVPGAASEAAGQLTEGTAAEPYARVAAALLAAPAVNALEKGARRVISPYGGADAGRLDLARVLDDAGVPVSAGQRVGNEALRRREGVTSGGQALNETQREALTAAALKTAGTDATRATPDVLAETAKRIGSVFDEVADGVALVPSGQSLQAIADAADTYRALAPTAGRAPVIDNIAEAVALSVQNNQPISATMANTWRSRLSKLTTSPDAATREAAMSAMGAVDDMLANGLNALGRSDDIARLATAREQYRNFLAIQRAATGAGEGAASGILSPSSLRSAVVNQGRSAYAQGRRGDLGELARAAEGVIRPLPTSGTAENIRAMGVPALGWSGAGGALGAGIGGPGGAAAGAIAGSVAPQAIGALRMSPIGQGYLANQMVGAGPDLVNMQSLSPVAAALAYGDQRR